MMTGNGKKRPLRVWLLKMDEPLPVLEGEPERVMRMGMLARVFVERGNDVTWWTSAFSHTYKRQRGPERRLDVEPGYRIELLRTMSYRQNISVRRFVSARFVANRFSSRAPREQPPDVMLAAMPTIDGCRAAVRYAKARGIPIAIDIRDLWPDNFLYPVPQRLRPAGRLALTGQYRRLDYACRNASAILGITDEFCDWGVRHAGRQRTRLDRAFPLAASDELPDAAAIKDATRFWESLGVSPKHADFLICFIGTFGVRNEREFAALFQAARSLQDSGTRVQFVLCGDGPRSESFRAMAAGCSNIVFPGWVQPAEAYTLMRMSQMGILPYENAPDFLGSIPNKVNEYLSAGLPVLSSLRGQVQRLFEERECGVVYQSENSESLVAQIQMTMREPDRLRERSRNARAVFEERFMASRIYHQMAEHVERLCPPSAEESGRNSRSVESLG